jgi:hypothetical protein
MEFTQSSHSFVSCVKILNYDSIHASVLKRSRVDIVEFEAENYWYYPRLAIVFHKSHIVKTSRQLETPNLDI